jgi:hypothetical protein
MRYPGIYLSNVIKLKDAEVKFSKNVACCREWTSNNSELKSTRKNRACFTFVKI